ncbi:MAG: HEAT repeat domain-containing protein [Candidatus Coatesbacteria bacterium]|nr:HEAT repeat domain-containing protein [Candidatus Coatesbacteria bacterium]
MIVGRKTNRTILKIVACIALALIVAIQFCCEEAEQKADPIKEIWRHSLVGEYDALKAMYYSPNASDSGEDVELLKGTCVDALGAIADDGATMVLVGILDDSLKAYPIPSLPIAQAILASGNEAAMEKIYSLAESEHYQVRHEIALAFNSCNFENCGPRPVDLLCKMLQDESRGVSTMAAHALGKVPDCLAELHVKAKQCLISYFLDPKNMKDRQVMMNLAGAFGNMEGPDVQGMIRSLLARAKNPPHDHVFGILHKLPEEEVMGYLEKFSRSDDEACRAWAASIACDYSSKNTIPIIKRLQTDGSVRVRQVVAGGLKKPFEGREEIVLRLANDESEEVRKSSTWSLATLDSPRAQRVLLDFIESGDRDIAQWALMGLSQSPHTLASDYLKTKVMKLSKSSRPKDRELAVALIEMYSMGDMDDVLLMLTEDRSLDVRRIAYGALYRIKPEKLREVLSID